MLEAFNFVLFVKTILWIPLGFHIKFRWILFTSRVLIGICWINGSPEVMIFLLPTVVSLLIHKHMVTSHLYLSLTCGFVVVTCVFWSPVVSIAPSLVMLKKCSICPILAIVQHIQSVSTSVWHCTHDGQELSSFRYIAWGLVVKFSGRIT